ncbi:restriction endonuclease [Providencia rettgeri]|uniref:AAA family ATPase n=1 Tax=Providencia TaxID=586 RepID=UPI001CFCCA41|nr:MULTISPECIES: restriction endonuclease [Providencia]EIU7555195.1 restriction endonuclease [Providencia rettgeri]MCB4839724.1 restriction endonuclease [Providencia rettgeri]MCG5274421.1 restriction endonuclease [Providencia rettgeri]MCG9508572.1 restriction endonuclease [Providencia rettgeri]
MTKIINDSFERWLSERPKWLQTAAIQIINNKRRLTEQELDALTELCLSEATLSKDAIFEAYVEGSLSLASQKLPLRILKLTDVIGVNALTPPASIDFGDTQLTVVYGPNGAGKSGYSRLLKQICGSQYKEDIHSNVFDKQTNSISATAHYHDGQSICQAIWTPQNGPCSALRKVQIFDTHAAGIYIKDKKPATYEPSKIKFVKTLISTCDEINTRLIAKKTQLVDRRPKFSTDISDNSALLWYKKVNEKTTIDDIEFNCNYTKEMDSERIQSESTLLQKDIPSRLKQIIAEKKALQQVNKFITELNALYSNDSAKELIESHNDALLKRKNANEAAQLAFKDSPLEGIGQSTWLAMWEQARKFSVSYAYPNNNFPHTEDLARCVLCQQELLPDAKERMKTFELFIKKGLEKNATQAENNYKNKQDKYGKLPDVADWHSRLNILKMDEQLSEKILFDIFNRKESLSIATSVEQLPVINWKPIYDAYNNSLSLLEGEEKSLQALQKDGGRLALLTRLAFLKTTQWLSQNKQAIIDEVKRLNKIAEINKAQTLARTNQLTTKSNELAEELISNGYRDRFASELNKLGNKRIRVKPKDIKQGKGNISFELELDGSIHKISPAVILSEGEARIVALSAFIADMTGDQQSTPFVFDDPISSLDQDYEERVVSRLIELSETRQVIIFTHRLSLVALVEAEAKKRQSGNLGTPVSVDVITLQNFAGRIGQTVPGNVRNQQPKKALNTLKADSLRLLKKAHQDGDQYAYDREAKSLCSNLRIIVERCVETILLDEVVLRFRRSVMTGNKLMKLVKITPADCQLIDDLMTRYSVYEHSQPNELPDTLPELSDIENDLDSLINWIEQFSTRSIPVT